MLPGQQSPEGRSCEGARAGGPTYQTFYDKVAAAQLVDWLPRSPCRVLDVSRAKACRARQLVVAGHQVVQVSVTAREMPDPTTPPASSPAEHGITGQLLPVVADTQRLRWLAEASVDAVLAEGQTLSHCLAAETTLADIARVLRPGGRMLLCVDSLVSGLARLAEQGRWAELTDVPAADVVLVPGYDGSISRCFGPEELQAMLAEAGLRVDWLRPRTVLPEEAVERALRVDPQALPALVRTEVTLSAARVGESVGIHLLVAATRPA